ncbi:hypothetical protein F5883DRAFT_597401 [Diaporthe sp. PMI_573]|nr:hypothetical protein F5883DRAFT_597401 [Diaporthaceae sp. PMI_573]
MCIKPNSIINMNDKGNLLEVVRTRLLVVRLGPPTFEKGKPQKFDVNTQIQRADAMTLKAKLDDILRIGNQNPSYWVKGETEDSYREEALDKALLRPGRVDVKVECGLATNEMAEQMFLRFFGPEGGNEASGKEKEKDGKETDGQEKKEKEPEDPMNQLSSEEAAQLAKLFGQRLGGEVLSGADLENYCVTIFGDPKKGVDDAEEWKKTTLAEKETLEKKRLLAVATGRKD